MIKRVGFFLAALAAVCQLAGCATGSGKILTGTSSKANYGIQLYATENVPFEYTELGLIRGYACAEAGWGFSNWPAEKDYMDGLVKEAQALGADAVLNFHIDTYVTTGGFILVLNRCFVEAQGVAVKIKRP